MKLCSDCKHWRPRLGPFGIFKSPHPRCAQTPDRQFAEIERLLPQLAEIERMVPSPGHCGPDAAFFEPKWALFKAKRGAS